MSLEVYNFVAVGVNSTCEDILLGAASDVVALDGRVLATADPVSSATCEGLNTSETLPCSVHVVSSNSQPFVFSPQVNLLSSPSSLQAVIAIPPPGLSVYQRTPVSPKCSQSPILVQSFSMFTYLFCNIQRTHRSPNSYPYNSLCSKFPVENKARRPCIERRIRSTMYARCLWCKVYLVKVCRPGSSSSALLSLRRGREWTPGSPGEGS